MTEEEGCGSTYEIGSTEIMAFGLSAPVDETEGAILICSQGKGHLPVDYHSDGTTDWRDE